MLSSGEAHKKVVFKRFVSGSRSEGLTLHQNWGHPEPDLDIMILMGNLLSVQVPHSGQRRGLSGLLYRPEGCPPGYAKLEVTNSKSLTGLQMIGGAEGCIETSDGKDWLNTCNLQSQIHVAGFSPKLKVTAIKGPALQVDGDMNEYVPALIANAPHPDIQEYIHRVRSGWPSQGEVREIGRLPMLLVLTSRKGSKDSNRQTRISCSPAEMKLLSKLSTSIKQGYIGCKYILKRFLANLRGSTEGNDGRSSVGSYHIKMVLLRHLEQKHPSSIVSPFDLMINQLHDLKRYLKDGKLPHYFLSQCDLLATLEPGEKLIARLAIHKILSDPLTAILTSPTEPHWIYGNVRPGRLIKAFRNVLADPTCSSREQKLIQLLTRLDKCRQLRYSIQLDEDSEEVSRVSERPSPIMLVEIMKHITPTPTSGSLPTPVVPIGLTNREAATKAFSSTPAAVMASNVGERYVAHHLQQQPSTRPEKQEVCVIGTSLIRGLGQRLVSQGINAITYVYAGAHIPLIRSRVPYILPKDNAPITIVLQCGGDDADKQNPDRIIAQYEGLIQDIRQQRPNAEILPSTIPTLHGKRETFKRINRVNDYLRERSARNDCVQLLDVVPKQPRYFVKDQICLNRNGKKLYVSNIVTSLSNITSLMDSVWYVWDGGWGW